MPGLHNAPEVIVSSRTMKTVAAAVCLILFSIASLPLQAAPEQIQALLAENKLDAALKLTNEELGKDPDNVTYRFFKGLILTKLNQLTQARDIFISLTKSNPELPEPYNNLAVVYAALGDYTAARKALQEAINTHPSYATAHENLGDIYARLASQAYNQALQLDEDNTTAKAKLALINDLFSMPAREQQAVAKKTEATPAPQPAPPQQQPATPQPATSQQVAAAATRPPVTRPPATRPEAKPEPEKTEQAKEDKELALLKQQKEQQQEIAKVRKTVMDWAKAWSKKDVDAYLSYYGEAFVPPDGKSLTEWKESRKIRLAKPRFIRVDISNLSVTMHGADHAQASFIQNYLSDTYTDRIKKTLLLKKETGKWLIVQELTS